MNKIKSFRDLIVWQKAHQLFLHALADMETLPAKKGVNFLAEQLLSSIGSVSANIAEGFKAASKKDYPRYLDIAKRSAAESENWLYKIKDGRLLDENICNKRIETCLEIQKMLHTILVKLKELAVNSGDRKLVARN